MCALSACLISACNKKAEAPAPDLAPTVSGQSVSFSGSPKGIRAEPAEKSANTTLSLPGRLVWDEDRTVRVFTPFAGRVVRALVQPGDSVKVGQALAELASPEFSQAQADARKAAADLAFAEKNVRRLKELNVAGIAADKDFQAAEADFQRAEGESDRAQRRLSQVGAGDGQNFVLKAPIAGVVVDKSINPGQELRPDQPGSPLFVISDLSRLWIWIDAAESEIAQLAGARPGAALVINSSAYPNRSFPGKIVKSADFIDPVSRTFKIRGTVDNAQHDLKAEMFVKADFPIAAAVATSPAQIVATAAVLLDGEDHYVFIADNDKTFVRVPVHIVREQPGRTTVTGLKEGQKVVVEGNLYLQQRVISMPAPQPASSEASKK